MTSDEIIKVIDELCNKFGVVIDWTGDNVLPYLEQVFERLVRYEITMNIIYSVICMVFIVSGTVGCVVVCKYYKRAKTMKESNKFFRYVEPHCEITDIVLIIGMLSMVSIIVPLGVLSIFVEDIIKWSMIPEIQIFEYIQHMIGGC